MDKHKALQALKTSDGRWILCATIHEEVEAIKEDFMWDFDPDKFEKKYSELHLMQSKVRALQDLSTMLDKLIAYHEPDMVVDYEI